MTSLRILAVAAVLSAAFGCRSKPDPAEAERLFQEAYSVIEGDREAGLDLFRRACDMRNAKACLALGVHARNGIERATAMERACRFGDYDSCSSAATILFELVGNILDEDGVSHWTQSPRADEVAELLGARRQVLQIGCDHAEGDEGYVCGELSKVWEHGIGGDIDTGKARAYRRKACEQGNKYYCTDE